MIRFEGEFSFSGDKSVTQRAILLGGVAQGETVICGAAQGKDAQTALSCISALGAEVKHLGETLVIKGAPRLKSAVSLDCGNSATCMRLLTGLLSGKGIEATLFGDGSLSRRPMARVAEPLTRLGARIETELGKPPIYISPAFLTGGEIALSIPSAQVKSALMLAGLDAKNGVFVVENHPTRDHTERMLPLFGAPVSVTKTEQGKRIFTQKCGLKGTEIDVAGDLSSAAYFMALGALKGRVLCKNVGVNPTRTGIFKAFKKLGVRFSLSNERTVSGEPRADVLVEKSELKAVKITAEEIPLMIDELPLIAILCLFANGESTVSGASELKEKESDRLSGTVRLIRALGGEAEETTDGWRIRGDTRLVGGDVPTALIGGDHRLCMTAAIALLSSEKGGMLSGVNACNVSFPEFFEKLKSAGAGVE